jgi:hypothetical protein
MSPRPQPLRTPPSGRFRVGTVSTRYRVLPSKGSAHTLLTPTLVTVEHDGRATAWFDGAPWVDHPSLDDLLAIHGLTSADLSAERVGESDCARAASS